jgi:two-component system, LytTR family, sensor kinase
MAVRWILLVAVAAVLAGAVIFWTRSSRLMGTPRQQATYETLHTASVAVSALRGGLTSAAAANAAPALRRLLGTPAVAIADRQSLLAYDGPEHHRDALARCVGEVVSSGRTVPLTAADVGCGHADDCPVRAGVAVPICVDGSVTGAIVALAPSAATDLVRATGEVARFVSTQLALAELDASRTRTVQAKLNFLRAQISPHFVYNALTAIESFVRSDPDRARDLLLGFAEFTRSTFREHSQYVTLAEELHLVESYLELERARFGDRLAVILRVAPETLSVRVPSLVLQPLVENAIRHGLERRSGSSRLQIVASDGGHEAVVTVEDDGAGADPRHLHDILSGRKVSESVGLRNVDERLRATFGSDHGLTIETGLGAGTKITMHLPKYSAALSTA